MDDKPVQLKLLDKPFACTVCGTDRFHKRLWEFKTPGSSFLKTGDHPIALICTQCGYVHCFMPKMGKFNENLSDSI